MQEMKSQKYHVSTFTMCPLGQQFITLQKWLWEAVIGAGQLLVGALQQKYPQIMCACLYIKIRLQGIRYTQGYVHIALQYATINLFNCKTKDGEACELEVNHCKGICYSILPKSFHFHAAYSVKGRQIKEIIGHDL